MILLRGAVGFTGGVASVAVAAGQAPRDHTVLVAIVGLVSAVVVALIATVGPLVLDRHRKRMVDTGTPIERYAVDRLLEVERDNERLRADNAALHDALDALREARADRPTRSRSR